jgi:hypothetical protein
MTTHMHNVSNTFASARKPVQPMPYAALGNPEMK